MIREEVLRRAEECATRHSAHVVDVVIRGDQHRAMVEVYIDAEASVTTDLCSLISRDLAETLDASDLIKSAYQLVVSSPGIERPLKFPWQYRKHVGRTFVVKIRTEVATTQVVGKLLSVEDEGIALERRNGNAVLRFSDIEEATVKAPW